MGWPSRFWLILVRAVRAVAGMPEGDLVHCGIHNSKLTVSRNLSSSEAASLAWPFRDNLSKKRTLGQRGAHEVEYVCLCVNFTSNLVSFVCVDFVSGDDE